MMNSKMMKFIDGNMGCMALVKELLMFPNGENYINGLISMNLKGSYAYMLWNDCTNRNINKTMKIISLYQQGIITDDDIEARVLKVGYGQSFDDFLEYDIVEKELIESINLIATRYKIMVDITEGIDFVQIELQKDTFTKSFEISSYTLKNLPKKIIIKSIILKFIEDELNDNNSLFFKKEGC